MKSLEPLKAPAIDMHAQLGFLGLRQAVIAKLESFVA